MIKKYSQLIIGICLGAILFGIIPAFGDELLSSLRIKSNPYPVIVNGEEKSIQAYNIDDYTYLKLADVGKLLGATVKFNETESKIEITKTEGENMEDTKLLQPEYTEKREKKPELPKTEDGVVIFTKDGEQVLTVNEIQRVIKINGYDILLSKDTGKWILAKGTYDAETKSIGVNYQVLIDNLQVTETEYDDYIDLAYYTNIILPLLQ